MGYFKLKSFRGIQKILQMKPGNFVNHHGQDCLTNQALVVAINISHREKVYVGPTRLVKLDFQSFSMGLVRLPNNARVMKSHLMHWRIFTSLRILTQTKIPRIQVYIWALWRRNCFQNRPSTLRNTGCNLWNGKYVCHSLGCFKCGSRGVKNLLDKQNLNITYYLLSSWRKLSSSKKLLRIEAVSLHHGHGFPTWTDQWSFGLPPGNDQSECMI